MNPDREHRNRLKNNKKGVVDRERSFTARANGGIIPGGETAFPSSAEGVDGIS